ncbi:hypothetical protein LTR56_017394 [Elasticomyces elasticus]|nr:hypothetical protein LTR56_017394 [Elasticomyces elasticus]
MPRMGYDEEARSRMNATALVLMQAGHGTAEDSVYTQYSIGNPTSILTRTGPSFDEFLLSPTPSVVSPNFNTLQPNDSTSSTFKMRYGEHPEYEEKLTQLPTNQECQVYQQPDQESSVSTYTVASPLDTHARHLDYSKTQPLDMSAQQPYYPSTLDEIVAFHENKMSSGPVCYGPYYPSTLDEIVAFHENKMSCGPVCYGVGSDLDYSKMSLLDMSAQQPYYPSTLDEIVAFHENKMSCGPVGYGVGSGTFSNLSISRGPKYLLPTPLPSSSQITEGLDSGHHSTVFQVDPFGHSSLTQQLPDEQYRAVADQDQYVNSAAQPSHPVFGDDQLAAWSFSPHLPGFDGITQQSAVGADQYGYDMQQLPYSGMQQLDPAQTSLYDGPFDRGLSTETTGGMVSYNGVQNEPMGWNATTVYEYEGLVAPDEDSELNQDQVHQHRVSEIAMLGNDVSYEEVELEDDEPEDDDAKNSDCEDDGLEGAESEDEDVAYSSIKAGTKRKASVAKAPPRKRTAHRQQQQVIVDGNGTYWVVKKARSGGAQIRFKVPFLPPPGKSWVAPTTTGPRAGQAWLRSISSNAALGRDEATQANISFPNTPMTGADSAYFYPNHHWPEMYARLIAAGWTERELAALHLYVHGKANPAAIDTRATALRQQRIHARKAPLATDFDVSTFTPRTARRAVKHELLTVRGDKILHFPPKSHRGHLSRAILYARKHPEQELRTDQVAQLAARMGWRLPFIPQQDPVVFDAAGRVEILKVLKYVGLLQ